VLLRETPENRLTDTGLKTACKVVAEKRDTTSFGFFCDKLLYHGEPLTTRATGACRPTTEFSVGGMSRSGAMPCAFCPTEPHCVQRTVVGGSNTVRSRRALSYRERRRIRGPAIVDRLGRSPWLPLRIQSEYRPHQPATEYVASESETVSSRCGIG